MASTHVGMVSNQGSPQPQSPPANPSGNRWTIHVRNAEKGVLYHLVFDGSASKLTGLQLKRYLEGVSKVSVSEQYLLCGEHVVSDDDTGKTLGLKDGGTLVLFSHAPGTAAAAGPPRPGVADQGPRVTFQQQQQQQRGTSRSRSGDAPGGSEGERRRAPSAASTGPALRRGDSQPAIVEEVFAPESGFVRQQHSRSTNRGAAQGLSSGPRRSSPDVIPVSTTFRYHEPLTHLSEGAQPLPPPTTTMTMTTTAADTSPTPTGQHSSPSHQQLSLEHPYGRSSSGGWGGRASGAGDPHDQRLQPAQPIPSETPPVMNPFPSTATTTNPYIDTARGSIGLNHSTTPRHSASYTPTAAGAGGRDQDPTYIPYDPVTRMLGRSGAPAAPAAAAGPPVELSLSSHEVLDLVSEREYQWKMEQHRFYTERDFYWKNLKAQESELLFEHANVAREREVLQHQIEMARQKRRALQQLINEDLHLGMSRQAEAARLFSIPPQLGAAAASPMQQRQNRSVPQCDVMGSSASTDAAVGGSSPAGTGMRGGGGTHTRGSYYDSSYYPQSATASGSVPLRGTGPGWAGSVSPLKGSSWFTASGGLTPAHAAADTRAAGLYYPGSAAAAASGGGEGEGGAQSTTPARYPYYASAPAESGSGGSLGLMSGGGALGYASPGSGRDRGMSGGGGLGGAFTSSAPVSSIEAAPSFYGA
eukprot:gene10323-7217_t